MNKNDKRNDNVANKKILIIFISVFVAAVLVFGLILGIIAAVKNSRAAVKYDGYTMSEEETAYFLSYYKYRYMMLLSQSGVENVEDTKGFWNKIDENENKTYGELLKSGAEQFLKEIIVSVSIFNRYDKLNSSEKTLIKSAAKNVLTYRADGNRDKFNELAAEYGFFEALLKAWPFCFYLCGLILSALGGLFTGATALKDMGGTVTAVSQIAEISQMGLEYFLLLLPLLAMNLAVFNVLPVPSLDGARAVFVLIEMVCRKPVNRKIEAWIHTVGLFLLLGLVVFFDIYHFAVAARLLI